MQLPARIRALEELMLHVVIRREDPLHLRRAARQAVVALVRIQEAVKTLNLNRLIPDRLRRLKARQTRHVNILLHRHEETEAMSDSLR